MSPTTIVRSSGLTRWSGAGVILVWIAVSIPFVFLYATSRRVLIDEIRHHAMGVAIAASASLEVSLLDQIHTPGDVSKPAFASVQRLLNRISELSPDIRYVYVMRRAADPLAPAGRFEYVVDQIERDDNGNGLLERDEQSEPPGTPYDASAFPEMIRAWDHPTADRSITPDPPYPDVISGYAPIPDAGGVTRAIVGVDITAATVHRKLAAVQIVILISWLAVGMLVMLVIHLYYQQRDAYERIKNLNEELGNRNELLRIANLDLWRSSLTTPRNLPNQIALLRDSPSLACAASGSDLCDAFELDHDHAVVFMAHVTGSGISAALVAGLLKMVLASVRDRSDLRGMLYVDLSRPDHVLHTLNEMLVKELPGGEFVSFVYAVIDLAANEVTLANAGHGMPIHVSLSGKLETWDVAAGRPLGVARDEAYAVSKRVVGEGDHLLFFGQDLLDVCDSKGVRFGDETLPRSLGEHVTKPPYQFLVEICAALDAHAGVPGLRGKHAMMDVQIR
ncbi:MAG: PP2C family protein-serine/threonine phosphatase [bacterium]